MEIIIDTNIMFNDWALRSEDSKAFLDFVERTGSIIYIPRIVWEETRKNYRNELSNKHAAYVKAARQFGRIFVEQPELRKVEIDFDVEANNYLDWLQKQLRFDALTNVLPYGDFTERIANRVMAKRKPFNLQNDHEYKDTLLWETVLDVTAGRMGRWDDEVVLISNDANAFGAGVTVSGKQQTKNQKAEKQVGVLHPELQEDIEVALLRGKAQNFYYYESFAEFLAAHYTHIKGIDEETVRLYLGKEESGFEQLLLKHLYARRQEFSSVIQSANPNAIIDVDIESIKVNEFSLIQDFYVYPFQKGEIVTASGTVFVYLNVIVNSSYVNHFKLLPTALNPPIEVKFNLPYIDGSPAVIDFESVVIPFSSGMILPEQAISERTKSKFTSILDHIDWARLQAAVGNQSLYDKVAKVIWDFKEPQLFELTDLELKWDGYRDKKRKLSDPASNYIPKRGTPQPFKNGNTSKRKKKGSKRK